MSYPNNNPFVRGYDGLSVQRLLAISYDDDCPLSYLPLHVSQSHLPDSQVERHACVFCDDFALITEGQNVPPEVWFKPLPDARANKKSPATIACRLPHLALTVSTPLRIVDSSITSSWYSDPRCTSSHAIAP